MPGHPRVARPADGRHRTLRWPRGGHQSVRPPIPSLTATGPDPDLAGHRVPAFPAGRRPLLPRIGPTRRVDRPLTNRSCRCPPPGPAARKARGCDPWSRGPLPTRRCCAPPWLAVPTTRPAGPDRRRPLLRSRAGSRPRHPRMRQPATLDLRQSPDSEPNERAPSAAQIERDNGQDQRRDPRCDLRRQLRWRRRLPRITADAEGGKLPRAASDESAHGQMPIGSSHYGWR